MKQINIILSLIFTIFVISESAAEKVPSYDDIYETIISGDKDKAYTLLLAYQKQEPDFANTYFQLALISEEWTKEFNPFTEFVYVKQFIYNTKLYYNLAKLKLADEKKKNRKYYINAGIAKGGRKFSLDDVSNFINSQTDSIAKFEKNILRIIENYNKSSNSYNKCVNIFMKINTEYSKIKNIYLADNDILTKNLEDLETNFDSTLIYFDLYKKALKKYPLEGYNQKYKLKQIVTYRLDGITYSNFLNNQILLWDYKTWVKNLKDTKIKKIKNNNSEIVKVEHKIKTKIKELRNEVYTEKFTPFKLDDKFIYKIEKFDNNSLLIKLFKFNEAKLNYYKYFRNSINNPNTISKYSLEKNAHYFYNLLKKQKYADSLNKVFNKNIKAKELRKYNKFYMTEYNGTQGLKEYSVRQDIFFNEKQKEAEKTINRRLYKTVYQPPVKFLTYKNNQITIKKDFIDFSTPKNESYTVCDFKKTNNNNLWFSGFYKTAKNEIQSFTALSEDMTSVKILSSGQINAESKSVCLLLETFPGGTYTIETQTNTETKNILKKYDNQGIKVSETELPVSKIPRLMKYDYINNSLSIIFSGSTINAITDADNEQIFYNLDIENNANSYILKYNAKAYVFDIIKLNKKIIVFSNFVNYKDTENKYIPSEAGTLSTKTNILATIISNKKIVKHVSFKNKKAIFGIKAIKINSNLINILGYKTEYLNKDFNKLKKEEVLNIYINSHFNQIINN